MKYTSQEKGWILYDCANSAYTTVINSTVFPIYFASVITKDGDMLWGIGTSFATIITAIIAPYIGAIADYRGNKKRIFSMFLFLGLMATLLSSLTDIMQIMLLGYVISFIGYSGSILVYDSFLTDVTTPKRMNMISCLGYTAGYIGGSTIPFLVSILLLQFGANFGIDATLAVKFSIVFTVAWWAVFSVPLLFSVHQNGGVSYGKKPPYIEAFKSLSITVKRILKNKGLMVYLIAHFFYIGGVSTVIIMASSYGTALNLSTTQMTMALFVTQIVAAPCTYLFGKLCGKFGALNMIVAGIIVYICICAVSFALGYGLENGFMSVSAAEKLFWVLAIGVGTVQGGLQAISRSYYGKIISAEHSGEYFGFLDVFAKYATALGPLIYSLTKLATGRSSYSLISIMLMFVIAVIILTAGRKHLKVDI